MASLREYTWSDGKTKTIQVRWRENGTERSMTFDDRKVAELTARRKIMPRTRSQRGPDPRSP